MLHIALCSRSFGTEDVMVNIKSLSNFCLHIAFNVPRFAGKLSSLELLERLQAFGEVVGDVLKWKFEDTAIATLNLILTLLQDGQIPEILPQCS